MAGYQEQQCLERAVDEYVLDVSVTSLSVECEFLAGCGELIIIRARLPRSESSVSNSPTQRAEGATFVHPIEQALITVRRQEVQTRHTSPVLTNKS